MHHVIFEAEQVASNNFWNDVSASGQTLRQMVLCNNNPPLRQWGNGDEHPGNATDEVAQSRMFYTFNVPTGGNYQVVVYGRAFDTTGGTDKNNDIWIRIASGSNASGETARDDTYAKMFRPNNGTIGTLNLVIGTTYVKFLPAGNHTIEIGARSCNMQVDRLVVWNADQGGLDGAWATKAAGVYENDGGGGTPLDCSQSGWDTNPDPGGGGGSGGVNLPAGSLYSPNDLLALHYDIAPDPDDIHAIAAGATVSDFYQITPAVVIGAYGDNNNRQADYLSIVNGQTLRSAGREVSERAYGPGWQSIVLDTQGTNAGFAAAVQAQADKWIPVLNAGNHIWVADGGPMDFTEDVIDRLQAAGISNAVIASRVHVIQHSNWNIGNTANTNFQQVQSQSDYIKIEDGNFFNATANFKVSGNIPNSFRNWAENSVKGSAWQFALTYFTQHLDFSDTVEYMHILGIGTNEINDTPDFMNKFN